MLPSGPLHSKITQECISHVPLEQDCELPKRKYFTAERCVSLGAVQMQYPEEEDSTGGYQREFGLSPFVLSVQFCNMGGLFVGRWIGFKGPWLEQKLPNGEWFLKPEPWVGS